MQPNIFSITDTDIMIIKSYLRVIQNVVMDSDNSTIEANVLRNTINIWRLINDIEARKKYAK